MKKSKNISPYRILLCVSVTCLYDSWAVFVFCLIFLLFFSYKETVVYFLICILFFSSFLIRDELTALFESFNNPIRNMVTERINVYSLEAQSALKLLLLNENDYSDYAKIGYGLTSFMFIRFMEKHLKGSGVLLCTLFSILFGFETRYLLFISEWIVLCFTDEKAIKNTVYLLLILLFSPDLSDYSLKLLFYLRLLGCFDSEIPSECVFMILLSRMFGSFNLTSVFFFSAMSVIRIFLYLFSLLLLVFGGLESLYLTCFSIYSRLYEITEIEIDGSITLPVVVLYFLFLSIFRFHSHFLKIAVLLFMIACPLFYPYAEIDFIDVGQGDAILFKDSFHQNAILLDTGSSYNWYSLNQHLKSKRIKKINTLIISHPDEDHNGNIANLSDYYEIEETVTKGKNIQSDDFHLIYHNLGTYEDENDNSLVYSLNKNNIEFLFTGDISSEIEKILIEEGYEGADVLKVAHHGSASSSSEYFISHILPRFSIISTNGKYNHPSEEVVDRLTRFGSEILNTKEQGTVEFIFVLHCCIVHTSKNVFVII